MRFGTGKILRDGKEVFGESKKCVKEWKQCDLIEERHFVQKCKSWNERYSCQAFWWHWNPGPFVVDCAKTICVAYSQGNALVLVQMLETEQRVVMSSLAIHFSTCKGHIIVLPFSTSVTGDTLMSVVCLIGDFKLPQGLEDWAFFMSSQMIQKINMKCEEAKCPKWIGVNWTQLWESTMYNLNKNTACY